VPGRHQRGNHCGRVAEADLVVSSRSLACPISYDQLTRELASILTVPRMEGVLMCGRISPITTHLFVDEISDRCM
jgi:hypothetical protein